MKCRKCNAEMTKKDISIEIAVIHYVSKLDIIITCPECGHAINAFIATEKFMDLES